MKRNIKVKPSKGQSKVGFFVGLIFCFIGLFVATPALGPFGLIWTMVAIIITVTHYKNAFTENGVATHEIVIEDFDEFNNHITKSDTQKRLEELKNLYDNGLMSKEEYEDKRKKVINSI